MQQHPTPIVAMGESDQLGSRAQQLVADAQTVSLTVLIDRASQMLAGARSAAEVIEARHYASFAYDAAKRAARLAQAKEAHDTLVAAALRAQADALIIESMAKLRLAEEYDAAQARGEVGKRGDYGAVSSGRELTPATAAELGLSRKEIHEARLLRDAELADPGIIKRTLESCVTGGKEPTKSVLRRAVAKAAQRDPSKAGSGDSNVVPFPQARSASEPLKKSSNWGDFIRVPDGATVESQVRVGMKLEREGVQLEKAAKAVGIGSESYRRVKELIVLLDEVQLNPGDRQIVATALANINQTRRMDGYGVAERIVARVWGTVKAPHTAKAAKKRLEHFDTVAGNAIQACEIVVDFEIPYLPEAKAKSLLAELEAARRNLDTFIRRIKQES